MAILIEIEAIISPLFHAERDQLNAPPQRHGRLPLSQVTITWNRRAIPVLGEK
jgi:hypothetical protein